ncbi:MAG: hypothetical protein GX386_06580 [Clostridiaceae bacterium]|jgi:hypothetical protein|nr:hypothetical protein [Clostridiaceae bacterium]
MDKQQGQQCRVKSIFFYLKESLKFYDVDKPTVAQVVFVLILAIFFGGYVLARPYTEDVFLYYEQISVSLMEQVETKSFDFSLINMEIVYKMLEASMVVIVIYAVMKAIAYLIGTYYGAFYFFSLTDPDSTWIERTVWFLRKLIKIIIFNILFYGIFAIAVFLIFIAAGFIALFVPAIIAVFTFLPIVVLAIDMLFIFKNLLIIEFDTGVFQNFKVALDITKDCRRRVIFNGLWPHFLGLILSTFAIDVQNPVLAIFMVSFFEVIVLLIFHRLTALMFIDAASLERKDKNSEKIIDRV